MSKDEKEFKVDASDQPPQPVKFEVALFVDGEEVGRDAFFSNSDDGHIERSVSHWANGHHIPPKVQSSLIANIKAMRDERQL